ncbi:MAG: hypothetical protein WCI20_06865 [bacterium]
MNRTIKIIGKIAVGILALTGAASILIAILFLNSWPRMHWPDVQSGIRRDCGALLAKYESAQAPKTEWPESIQQIKPQAVQTAGDHVIITISGGGIGAAWGFVVFPGDPRITSERMTGMKIWGTGQPGIFKYQTIE